MSIIKESLPAARQLPPAQDLSTAHLVALDATSTLDEIVRRRSRDGLCEKKVYAKSGKETPPAISQISTRMLASPSAPRSQMSVSFSRRSSFSVSASRPFCRRRSLNTVQDLFSLTAVLVRDATLKSALALRERVDDDVDTSLSPPSSTPRPTKRRPLRVS